MYAPDARKYAALPTKSGMPDCIPSTAAAAKMEIQNMVIPR